MPYLTKAMISDILEKEIDKAAKLRKGCCDVEQQNIVQALIEAKKAFDASDFGVMSWHQDAPFHG